VIGILSARSIVRLNWGVYLVLTGSLTGGLYGRLAGFGERQLAVDEYYSAESVDLILKGGVPRFDRGSITFRGCQPSI
jgi:hypothetical protein